MDQMPASLSNLLDQDARAKHYFNTLPPDTRIAMYNQNISSFEELKARADHILFAPF